MGLLSSNRGGQPYYVGGIQSPQMVLPPPDIFAQLLNQPGGGSSGSGSNNNSTKYTVAKALPYQRMGIVQQMQANDMDKSALRMETYYKFRDEYGQSLEDFIVGEQNKPDGFFAKKTAILNDQAKIEYNKSVAELNYDDYVKKGERMDLNDAYESYVFSGGFPVPLGLDDNGNMKYMKQKDLLTLGVNVGFDKDGFATRLQMPDSQAPGAFDKKIMQLINMAAEGGRKTGKTEGLFRLNPDGKTVSVNVGQDDIYKFMVNTDVTEWSNVTNLENVAKVFESSLTAEEREDMLNEWMHYTEFVPLDPDESEYKQMLIWAKTKINNIALGLNLRSGYVSYQDLSMMGNAQTWVQAAVNGRATTGFINSLVIGPGGLAKYQNTGNTFSANNNPAVFGEANLAIAAMNAGNTPVRIKTITGNYPYFYTAKQVPNNINLFNDTDTRIEQIYAEIHWMNEPLPYTDQLTKEDRYSTQLNVDEMREALMSNYKEGKSKFNPEGASDEDIILEGSRSVRKVPTLLITVSVSENDFKTHLRGKLEEVNANTTKVEPFGKIKNTNMTPDIKKVGDRIFITGYFPIGNLNTITTMENSKQYQNIMQELLRLSPVSNQETEGRVRNALWMQDQ